MKKIEDIRKKYQIIYGDPAWFYSMRNNPNTQFGLGNGGHYPMMKTKDICALNVYKITAEQCFLMLWTTCPKVEDALKVMKAWGFSYVTVLFIWIKIDKRGNPMKGPGNYSQTNGEIVLLGRTKKIYKVYSLAASQVILAPRRKHSQKPDETRDRIIQIFGDRPRIELFARQKIKGWDCWGDEV